MAESTLAVQRDDVVKRVAYYLGWGRTAYASLSSDQQSDMDAILSAGISRFYGEHNWNFLSPTTTITATADGNDDDLPDGFGSLVETFYYAADKAYPPLIVTSPGRIRNMIATSDTSGIVTHCAINVKSGFTGTTGDRFEVLWYPAPSEAFVFTYRYNVLRDVPASATTYPAGGAAHRNTIIEACLAEAELQLNDGKTDNTNGVHEQKYQQCLQQSMFQDRLTRAKNLGYNGDSSDGTSGFAPVRYAYYNGAVGT